MQITITPTFEDIFSEVPPKIEELLEDIPLHIIVGIISYINGQLFNQQNSNQLQLSLLDFVSKRFNIQIQQQIGINVLKLLNRNDGKSIAIFTEKVSVDFILYLVKSKHIDFEVEDSTPEQELRIFKAYLLFSTLHSNEIENKFDFSDVNDNLLFQKNTWPLMIKQATFNGNIQENLLFELLKSIYFLKYFSENTLYSNSVTSYLNFYSIPTIYNYTVNLTDLIRSNLDDKNKRFCLKLDIKLPILDNLCFNNFPYPTDDKEYFDYTFLKSKPLFKLSDKVYLVLNWHFFSNQLYNGLVFDFYHKSGIKSYFPRFDTYKSDIGKHISEEVFKILITEILNPKKYDILHFDLGNGEQNPIPDVYFRRGKYIFLIEFKDTMMPKDVPEIGTFEKIKIEIDKKFASKKEKGNSNKGIFQIINQLKFLQDSTYFFDDFEIKQHRKNNVVIFPILVYTDTRYNMPGVGGYLSNIFDEYLNNTTIRNSFQKVHPLTFINWEFFNVISNFLSDKEIKFEEWIIEYHKQRLQGDKSLAYQFSTEKLFRVNSNFDEYLLSYMQLLSKKKRRKFDDYVGKLLQKIGLKS